MSDPKRTKVFKNGGSQAVRLPKFCRFPEGQEEVSIRKEGHTVIIEPLDEWTEDFESCLGAWDEKIDRLRVKSDPKAKDVD